MRLISEQASSASTSIAHSIQPNEHFKGVEAINMMRKGQVKRLDKSDAMGQAKFVASLFQVAA
jgi:hypothetical protein